MEDDKKISMDELVILAEHIKKEEKESRLGKPKQPIRPIPEVVSLKEIYEAGNNIKTNETEVLYYLLYLTGARISEVLEVRKRDFDVNQISNEIKTTKMIYIKLITKKNRRHKTRTVPIPIDNPMVEEMVSKIGIWLTYFDDQEKIFKMTRNSATMRMRGEVKFMVRAIDPTKKGTQTIDEYELNVYPHYLRHCRLTHLLDNYKDLKVNELKYIAGWTSTKPAEVYIRQSGTNVAKHLMI